MSYDTYKRLFALVVNSRLTSRQRRFVLHREGLEGHEAHLEADERDADVVQRSVREAVVAELVAEVRAQAERLRDPAEGPVQLVDGVPPYLG